MRDKNVTHKVIKIRGLLMKKNKLLVLGLIALMLVGGLALASCGSKCIGDGNCKLDAGTSGNLKWCGSNITDEDDAKKAAECGVIKDYDAFKTDGSSCDC
jgi:hypothetical protein